MRNLAILFPGQGSQYIGMGQKELLSSTEIADMFDLASDILSLDMRKLCFSESAETLNKTENTQPALLLCSLAAYRAFVTDTGLKPSVMAGHSLGELSALVAAGSITLKDGLLLAQERGRSMSTCCAKQASGMSAVKYVDAETIASVCKEIEGYGRELVIANYNASRQHVLSGSSSALHAAGQKLIASGGTVIPLRVSGAFHSSYMAEAEARVREMISGITVFEPAVSVIANIDAQPYQSVTEIKDKLVRQITSPVKWRDSLINMALGGQTAGLPEGEKVDCYVEAGPGQVLSRIVEQVVPRSRSFSLDDEGQRGELLIYLENDIRTLKEKPSILGKCLAVAVSTKNNNWDESSYTSSVLAPYEKLKQLHENNPDSGCSPEECLIDEGFSLLKQILDGKGVPEIEQHSRFRELEYLCDAY